MKSSGEFLRRWETKNSKGFGKINKRSTWVVVPRDKYLKPARGPFAEFIVRVRVLLVRESAATRVLRRGSI